MSAPPHPTVTSLMGELATPAGQADPYPIYSRLRELGDAVAGPDEALIVTGYRECSALLREPRLRKNPGRLLAASGFPDWEQRPALRTMFTSLLMINPPEHTRLRGLVNEWSMVLEILNPPTVDRADEAASAIVAYFHELAARRRAEPADDLISALVSAGEGDQQPLSDDELVKMAALILAAGFETTTGLLANGLLALLDHPAQADRLRREPELAKPGVEELLRYDTPVQLIYGRSAVDEIEVGELRLSAGQRVITVLGAGNRDPKVFTSPDELILERDEGAVLSFGAGIHHCLGAALARLEGQVMLPKLLQRFPGLHLAREPQRRPGIAIHSYSTLPVATH